VSNTSNVIPFNRIPEPKLPTTEQLSHYALE